MPYEFHPIADLLPLMPEAELAGLTESIKANGLQVPIILYQETILDGRNRYLACGRAGVKPQFIEYTGNDPLRYSIAMNIQRRQLKTGQKAAVAANLANLSDGQRADYAGAQSCVPVITQEDAAALVGEISVRSVQDAVAIKKANSGAFSDLLAGRINLQKAKMWLSIGKRKSRKTRKPGAIAPKLTDEEAALLIYETVVEEDAAPKEEAGIFTTVELDAELTRGSEILCRGELDTNRRECFKRFKLLIVDLSNKLRMPQRDIKVFMREYLAVHCHLYIQ